MSEANPQKRVSEANPQACVTVWLVNQDGGDVGEEEFDCEEDALRRWPEAEPTGDGDYVAWIGGGG